MDNLADELIWLYDWVYLFTVVEGLDSSDPVLVKDHLVKKWSDPDYVLTDEETRLMERLLENEQERSRRTLGE
jgi:hypothetical protein